MTAYTMPISTADFLQRFYISEFSMRLAVPANRTISRSGEVFTQASFPFLWRGSIAFETERHSDARAIESIVEYLTAMSGTFLVFDRSLPFPANDRQGTLFAALTPTLHTIAADRLSVRITGQPSGFLFSAGDLFSVAYSSNPTRYTLHRIVRVYAPSGTTSGFLHIIPKLPEGINTGTAVTVYRAHCKATILTDTVKSRSAKGVFSSGTSFEWVQTLV